MNVYYRPKTETPTDPHLQGLGRFEFMCSTCGKWVECTDMNYLNSDDLELFDPDNFEIDDPNKDGAICECNDCANSRCI